MFFSQRCYLVLYFTDLTICHIFLWNKEIRIFRDKTPQGCLRVFPLAKIDSKRFNILFKWFSKKNCKRGCCIFRPAFGCCRPQTLVQIVIFSNFFMWIVLSEPSSFFMSVEAFYSEHWIFFCIFFLEKKLNQRLGPNSKNPFFAQICYFLRFFIFLAQKLLKMIISTSIWGAKHPNAGWNIQQEVHCIYLK